MSIDDKRIESVTDFFHTVTFGMERKHYNGIELGSNIFIIYRIGRMKECTMSDITNYLNRAEEFGERIENFNMKENTHK